MNSPKRLLIFVHYNKWGELSEYVVFLLKKVRKIFAKIVFISNSPLSEQARAPLAGLYDDFLQRENEGSNFLAWKDVLMHEGIARLAAYDSVTLMNDTCFGPLFDLRAVYRRMEKKGVDFWGITNGTDTGKETPDTNAPTGEYIQSYFISFTQNVVRSAAFVNFWNHVKCQKNICAVDRKYEIQLTSCLKKAEFVADVLYDTSKLKLPSSNSASIPDILLQQHVPFMQINSLLQQTPPENDFFISCIQRKSRYPIALIYNYFSEYLTPEKSIAVTDHALKRHRKTSKAAHSIRSALHIHAFYTDIMHDILTRIVHGVHSPLDIFITTDSAIKASHIKQMLQWNFSHLYVRDVCVLENRGRDVWPWLRVAQRLADYDVAGHLHTKKSPIKSLIRGKIWLEENLAALLDRFEHIQSAFHRESSLGIIIPDIPTHFIFNPYVYITDTSMKTILQYIWNRLDCKKNINFSHLHQLVFPYGNMFWYRPKALEPLWNAKWSEKDIPIEPIQNHGTTLHALERLPVYVAWSEGYNFRISRSNSPVPYGFLIGAAREKDITAYKAAADKATFLYMRSQIRNRLLLKSH